MLFSFGQSKEPNNSRYYEKSRGISQLIKLNRVNNAQNNASFLSKNKEAFQNSNAIFSKLISSPLVVKYGIDYQISQTWDDNTSQLVDDLKTEYTYDNKGNVTQYIHYNWDGGQWVLVEKKECSYDSNGNLTQVIIYACGESLCLAEKDEYTYDINGYLSEHFYYYWDGSQWGYNGKTEYIHNVYGNILQEIDYFPVGPGQWYYNTKIEYYYDTNGNISAYILYYWDFWLGVPDWVNNMKTEYIYDIKGNLTKYIVDWWFENQWYTSDKSEFTYDTNGNMTQNVDYWWDPYENQWINTMKNEFTYNDSYSFSDLILPYFYKDSNFEIIYIHQMLNDGVGKIFNMGELFFNHMMTNRAKYDWNSNLNDWAITDNYAFSYSEQDILSVSESNVEQFKIYPNPVSNVLTIKSEIETIEKVQIYSVLGKKIKEINMDFENISTEDLSKGIYLLRIYSEKGMMLKKLIKK